MPKKVNYIVNKPVHGFRVGQTVALGVDGNGVPIDRLWRRRVRDAKIDGCLTVAVVPKTKEQSKSKTRTAKEDE